MLWHSTASRIDCQREGTNVDTLLALKLLEKVLDLNSIWCVGHLLQVRSKALHSFLAVAQCGIEKCARNVGFCQARIDLDSPVEIQYGLFSGAQFTVDHTAAKVCSFILWSQSEFLTIVGNSLVVVAQTCVG